MAGRAARWCALAVCTWFSAAIAEAASLTVEVIGLESDQGDVHIALYDNPAAFPKSDGMRTETRSIPQGRRAEARFDDLPPGRYAIAAYHDADGDHSFTQGLFGIPLEAYGFSNGAGAFFGPPTFEAAAFEVGSADTQVRINLGN